MLSATLTPLAPWQAAPTAATRALPAARSAGGAGVCAKAGAARTASVAAVRRVDFIGALLVPGLVPAVGGTMRPGVRRGRRANPDANRQRCAALLQRRESPAPWRPGN